MKIHSAIFVCEYLLHNNKISDEISIKAVRIKIDWFNYILLSRHFSHCVEFILFFLIFCFVSNLNGKIILKPYKRSKMIFVLKIDKHAPNHHIVLNVSMEKAAAMFLNHINEINKYTICSIDLFH